ncbi:ribonuclease T2 family protein, partial [Pseudorhodoplanes sp.]|uniref:ribonuclease T2 family protein n=1 Tax=Pseudorhodoplanes sp. TaxID=1934341 RepID=UPI003D0AC43C
MSRIPKSIQTLFRGIVLAAFVLGAAALGGPEAALARDTRGGDFDYYALALSWSPTFCQSPAGDDADLQCNSKRRYDFVVHGLWPQYEKGWPDSCQTRERWVPDELIDAMLDLMPSKKLIIHEWRKHGTCSGLKMRDYFALIRAVYGKVKIPARYVMPNDTIITTPQQLVTDFVKSNRDLTEGMISVQCGNRRDDARLSELRICFTRDGEFRECGSN